MISSIKRKFIFTATILIAGLVLATGFASAQTTDTDNSKPSDQTTTPKDHIKIKRDERDTKTIIDRTLKIKDDYVIQIKLKFLNSADKLASISTKIETRVTKLNISGQDTADMQSKLNSANEDIKQARAILKTLPAKQANINYTDAKKYADSIIDARSHLESAKETLTNLISDLKDFIIDKDDEKN